MGHSPTMDSSNNDVVSALRNIASTNTRASIEESYNDVGGVMKEVGAPSNNMLLSALHGETRRTADEVMKLNSRVVRLEEILMGVHGNIERLCELMEVQNTMMSSRHISDIDSSRPSWQASRSSTSLHDSKYFYQGAVLDGKYKICACVLLQLMDIVKLRMENMGIRYPD